MKRIGMLLLLCVLLAVPAIAQTALTVGVDQTTRDQWNTTITRFQAETGIRVLLRPYPANALGQQIALAGATRSGKFNLVMVRENWGTHVLRHLADLGPYKEDLLEEGASIVYWGRRPVGVRIPFAPDWFLAVLSWPDDEEEAVLFLEMTGQSDAIERARIPIAIPAATPAAAITAFRTTKIAPAEHNPLLDGALQTLLSAAQASVGTAVGAMAADFMARLPRPAQAALSELASLHGIPFNPATATVTVVLEPQPGRTPAATVAALAALGVRRPAIDASTSLVRVSVPLSQLATIAARIGGVSFIRPPHTPHALGVPGQGVGAIGAAAFHAAGITGSGVRVAIIDLGFAGLSQAQARGDLPRNVHKHDLTRTGLTSGITHGTAVAEIVHEIAPGAELHLIKIADEVDLDLAVAYALNNGIDIINHSLGWFNTNFSDGTGTIAEIAKRAIAGGIVWINAAGNEAQSHWKGTFTDRNRDTWHDQALTFHATSGSQVILYMTWNDWPDAASDYDLYLYDPAQNLIASSTKHQTGTEEPTEAIMTVVRSTGTHTVRIRGSGSMRIKVHNLYQGLSPAIAASSILAPGNVAAVVTVGAIDHRQYTTGPLSPHSSRGPTADGRAKPDLTAPDNVSTGTHPHTSFAGTSGAAPHVAGAAALLLSQDTSLNEPALRAHLLTQTVAMGNRHLYGRGRLVLSPPTAANRPPNASFTISPSTGPIGTTFTF
ncbi:S8 family serine peptidase, partial [Candidatus Bipolaricaulota bacterium]|nr:S8 family serine peptidase [Candidatus Bipolaricaulota bacterium]